MRYVNAILGVMLGLAIVWGVGRWVGSPHASPSPAGPMMAEFGPPLRTIVVHHVAGSDATLSVIRAFISHLPAEARVCVVCPDDASFAEFREVVALPDERVIPAIVNHPITPWSRDRWVALLPHERGSRTVLLHPFEEAAADAWPARRGDQRVAGDLANVPQLNCVSQMVELRFDGGDLMADDRHVFVSRAVLERNIGSAVQDRDELLDRLRDLFGRTPVLLDDGPDHHVGMYMMSMGQGVALVGDPAMGLELLGRAAAPMDLPGGVDASAEMQARFDAVAQRLKALGYRVRRVPTLVGAGSKAYVTYVNVMMDVDAAGQRIVYMPVYRGLEDLNQAARDTWAAEGFEVRPIDCTDVYQHGGTLHCLVNVTGRGAR